MFTTVLGIKNWIIINYILKIVPNIQVKRVCLYCNCEFIARTTKIRYCSHRCNSRHYKQLAKEEKISVSNIQSSAMGLLKTKVDFPELNTKPFLTINESSASFFATPPPVM
jgi:hypothetical protein